jgi:hypothetical protein
VIESVKCDDPLTFNYLGDMACRSIAARNVLLELTKRFTCRCRMCLEPDRLRALPCLTAECAGALLLHSVDEANPRPWLCDQCAKDFTTVEMDSLLCGERFIESLVDKAELAETLGRALTPHELSRYIR